MTVPIHFKFCGIEISTEISVETPNKIACGALGVAAGTAVMAAGVAAGNSEIIKLGGGIAVAGTLAAAAAIGLGENASAGQLRRV